MTAFGKPSIPERNNFRTCNNENKVISRDSKLLCKIINNC